MASVESNSRQKTIVKLFLAVVIIAGVIFLLRYFQINEVLKKLLLWIESLGIWGALVFIIAYICATVLFLPGSVLTLGAGFLFGVAYGSIFISIGSTLGASAAFLVGRYFARDWVLKKIEGNDKFRAIDEAVANEGWKIVFLCRLSPVFPFNMLNYAFGLTKVKFKHYFFASWSGMIPGTIMYVYIGSLASSLATLGAGQREKSPMEWGLYIIGLLAAIIVTIYVTRVARRALNKSIHLNEEEKH